MHGQNHIKFIRIRDDDDDYDCDTAFILEWKFQGHKTSHTTIIGKPTIMGSKISGREWSI
jgi:hypothetical protein